MARYQIEKPAVYDKFGKTRWIAIGVIILLGSVCFVLFAVSVLKHNHRGQHGPSMLYQSIRLNKLPNGALLFRRGKGTEADAIVIAKSGGIWSHVGIIASGPNGLTVIHAAPSEEDGQPDVVKEDTLEYFLADERAADATVMMVAGAGEKEAKVVVAAARSMIGQPFGIHSEGDNTSGEIYCTELVILAWESAGITLTSKRDNLRFPFLGGVYLLPDTLAASNLLRPIQLSFCLHLDPQYENVRIGADIQILPRRLFGSDD